tara:strand:+ start:581 stop:892 length:312 start_codon:yes stop_codon:yes gene_type:complete
MNFEDIEFVISLEPLYDNYKKTQVLSLNPEQAHKLRIVYQSIYGRGMPSCSTCFVEAYFSLLIFAHQKLDSIKEQAEWRDKQRAIEQAQLADDEHKPKRKKKP